jgi:hypothetical protein
LSYRLNQLPGPGLTVDQLPRHSIGELAYSTVV